MHILKGMVYKIILLFLSINTYTDIFKMTDEGIILNKHIFQSMLKIINSFINTKYLCVLCIYGSLFKHIFMFIGITLIA